MGCFESCRAISRSCNGFVYSRSKGDSGWLNAGELLPSGVSAVEAEDVVEASVDAVAPFGKRLLGISEGPMDAVPVGPFLWETVEADIVESVLK